MTLGSWSGTTRLWTRRPPSPWTLATSGATGPSPKSPPAQSPASRPGPAAGAVRWRREAIAAYPCPSEAYSDLNTDQWYHEYTDYVIRHGLMEGMGDGKFAPDGSSPGACWSPPCTPGRRAGGHRAYHLPGRERRPLLQRRHRLGRGRGHRQGHHGKKLFAPDYAITREQAVTFLYRYVTEYLKQAPPVTET